ncbi:MAG: glycosyltransferase family 4 protein [Pseudomonadota bacterium]
MSVSSILSLFRSQPSGRRPALKSADPGARPDGASRRDRPLTILQVVPQLGIGGVERGTLEIAEAIVQAGGRALVASAGGQLAPRLMRAGAELVEMNAATKNPFNIWQNAGVLTRLIRAEGVDLVHARSRAPAWSAWRAAERAGVPFVTTYHGSYSEDFPGKRFYNSIMARGRPVIAVSEYTRAMVIERHCVAPEDIVVIPRGADVEVFSEDVVGGQRTAGLAERWGLLDDARPVVMLPGRLTRWKGAESLIEAAGLLSARRGGPDFIVLIVGEDGGSGYADVLERRIREHGVEDFVHLAGAVSDMAAAYKLASVVVSASIEPEAFGRVAVEAQAMGRPVVATDHGGARETVAHGETGLLYPPGDTAALAAAIDQILQLDESEKAHMRLSARARIHAQFTTRTMQRHTLDVYERATGRLFSEA